MLSTGCATSLRTHLTNLQNDAMDMSRASVAISPIGRIGYGVNLKATKLLEAQMDDYDAYRVGWVGRGVGVWEETSLGGVLCTKYFPMEVKPNEKKVDYRTEFEIGGGELIISCANTLRGRADPRSFTHPADEFRLAAHLGYVGADIGIRPLEAVDFLCGLLSLGWIDILKDDQPMILRQVCQNEVHNQGNRSGTVALPEKDLILDVRTREEYDSGHLSGAVLIPHNTIRDQISTVAPNKEAPIFLYCRSGDRASLAHQTLKAIGYTQVVNLGGIAEASQKTQLSIRSCPAPGTSVKIQLPTAVQNKP
jgi:phage shock protein E